MGSDRPRVGVGVIRISGCGGGKDGEMLDLAVVGPDRQERSWSGAVTLVRSSQIYFVF